MAKRISDEEIRLNVVINGDQSQKELFEQEKRVRELNAAQKELRKEKQLLEKQGKKDSDQYRAVTAALRENNTEISKSKARMQELQQQIGLTSLTSGQLRSEATRLRMVLSNLIPGSEDYIRYEQDLKKVNDRLGELKGKGQQAKWSIGGLADNFNRYAALGASVIAAGTGVVLSIQKVLDMNGKLSDSQTNVMKTTGMTKQEVDELTKSFGMLKTRTGRIDLLGIAEVGGRLGIAKAEIADFVKVMDKSAVALGDSFEGGPDVVAEKLGRIKGLYDELKNAGVEEAFESVGSALNDLGAAGTASEQNVAEFTQRVGTLPGKLKPSIQTALGLGAAFEESGLKAELAGTNYGKVISIAARDTAAFAKVMNRPVKDLEKLVNDDPTEFFLQFSQALKGLDPTDLAKVLDYLKLNDNEVKMVLGAASDNVDLFRDKIKLAGESMAEATSLTNEYNLKNNNLAATLDRIKKKVFGWFTSDSFVAFLESAVNWFAKFIGAIEDDENKVSAFKNTLVFVAKAFAIVTAAMVTNVAWMKLVTVWTARGTEGNLLYTIGLKAKAVAEGAAVISTRALVLVHNLLTGNIKGAIQAFKALSAAMKTTPFGLVLTVAAAAAAAYYAFSESAVKATEAEKAFNEIHNKVVSGLQTEKEKIDQLISVAKDDKIAKETRLKAIKDLNEISPEYLGNLTLEKIGTEEATQAINAYIAALDKKLEAEEIENQIRASKGRVEAINQADVEDYKHWYDGMFDWETEKAQNEAAASRIGAAIKVEEDLQKSLLDRRKQLYVEMQKMAKKDPIVVGGATAVDEDAEKKAKEKADKEAELRRKWRDEQRKEDIENAKNLSQELLELQEREIDEQIALKKDGFDKERQLEAENHNRKMLDLKKQLVDEAVIAKLDERIDNPETKPLDRGYLMHYKEQLLDKNKRLNRLIEIEEQRHRLVTSTIYEKEQADHIQKMQAAYEREGVILQTKHNNDLAALGNNEVAKVALQKKFDAAEIDRQQKHLEKLIAEKQSILKDLNSRIDLTALTPDQRKVMEDEINKLLLQLSELAKAKAELEGKEGSNDIKSAGRKAFGDTDILGFTPDQWEQLYRNIDTLEGKLKFAAAAIQGMQNIWGLYNDFVAAGENRQLSNFEKNANAKKKKLKWQLDNGYISQSQYQKQLEQMDADLEKKRAEIEYKQAKRQKTAALFEATVNTAKGITAAIPNLFLMALAATAGALQIATIAKTPLPARGYEEGLYPEAVVKREQDGKIFNAGYGGRTRSGLVRRPTYFLAGENGPEMVIDAQAYRQMSPGTRDLLIRELRGIKGFEKGRYNTDVTGQPRYELPAGPAPSGGSAAEILLEKALVVIAENTAVMRELRENGVSAWIARDYRNYKDLQEDLDKLKASRDKAQQ